VKNARGEVVSIGFVISLWAGSSAISSFVDSVVEAHDQTPLRHPVRQRFFALGLYVVMLVAAIAAAPFVALGPRKIAEQLPQSWDNALAFGYYPVLFLTLLVVVNFLYRVSLPEPLPSHRLIAFFLGFAIMLGAELNAAIQEEWPASHTHAKRVRLWLKRKAADSLNGDDRSPVPAASPAQTADGKAALPARAGLPAPPAGTDAATS
jgi:membrane protein